MPEPTPDPRATLELLTDRANFIEQCITTGGLSPAACHTTVLILRNAIADLRRLADLELEAQADDAQIAALEKEVEQLRGEPGVNEERLAEVEEENARLKTLMDKIFDQHPEARTLYSCA